MPRHAELHRLRRDHPGEITTALISGACAGGGRDQAGADRGAPRRARRAPSARSSTPAGTGVTVRTDVSPIRTHAPRCATPGDGRAELLPMVTKPSACSGRPADKRHRIVNSVGNDPTEAPSRAIGMFPSHQLGNSPIEFSGPSTGLLPRRICQKTDLTETIPCLETHRPVETHRPSGLRVLRHSPRPSGPPVRRDPPSVGTPHPSVTRAGKRGTARSQYQAAPQPVQGLTLASPQWIDNRTLQR